MDDEDLKASKLLIVDDDQRNTMLLEAILKQAGYSQIKCLNESREALGAFRSWGPDLVVLDQNMPIFSGFDVMRQLRDITPTGAYLPIVMITADLSREVKLEALALGAKEFLNKPIDQTEVRLRIRNLLETRALHQRLQAQNATLDAQVQARTAELEQAQVDSVRRLALAAEYRDDVTGWHTWRVGELAALVAKEIGWTEPQVDIMRLAASLHDVGKIGIPDRVLLKPGRFTPEEFESMKEHVTIGAKLLSGSRAPLLQLAETIAKTHHERWDGTGYLGLTREQIPLPGRIVTLADVFDALTHQRPYKDAWTIERAREEIKSEAGRQFDPELVEHFLRIVDREGDRLVQSALGQRSLAA